MCTLRPGAVVAALLWAGGAPGWAAPGSPADGGATLEAALKGEVSPREAIVRASAARVVVRATARRQQGVAIGVDRFDEVECEVTLRNTLDHPVREVIAEVTLRREGPGQPGRLRARSDDDEGGGAAVAGGTAIAGWRFRLPPVELPPQASRTVSTRQPLPPLEEQDRPAALAEVSYGAQVLEYRVPGLPLSRALEVLERGTPADQRSVWKGYGEGVRGDARAFDEAVLLGLLGAGRSRQERWSTADLKRSPEAPRAPLAWCFLLQAARRIGGSPTLEGLLMHEAQLVASAPPLPPRLDEAHPAPLADLLPDNLGAALHEALVEVAHHNLAGLYTLLHAPPPPPPPSLLQAARQLAVDEGLEEPDAWLEAAAALPPDQPQLDPTTDREGRLPIVAALARLGGAEVVPALAQALDSDVESLRSEVAAALARRGGPGVAVLVGALDSDDLVRRRPVEAALWGVDGPGREALARLARGRGLPIDDEATPADLVAALAAAQARARADAVLARLTEVEARACRDGLDPGIGGTLAGARALSPRAYAEAPARARLGRIAACVYRARAAAGRADARALLDEVGRLGPIGAPEYQAALRDARIAEARAVAGRDLPSALALLGPEATGEAGDPGLREVARELVLGRLDAALDRGDLPAARALDEQARRLAVPPAAMEGRARRLRALRARRPLLLGAGLLACAGLVAAGLLVRRRLRGGAVAEPPAGTDAPGDGTA